MIEQLHRKLEALQRSHAAAPVLADKHRELADAYQAAAARAADPGEAWTCYASAVVHLVEAGDRAEARHVAAAARERFPELVAEAAALTRWLDARASA
jgi:hypothetical protein